MGTPTSARIVARRPLLEAGLRRLALGADVAVVDDIDASFVLRSPDQVADGSPLDVTIAGDAVVVTCRRPPSTAEWDAVRRVVEIALG